MNYFSNLFEYVLCLGVELPEDGVGAVETCSSDTRLNISEVNFVAFMNEQFNSIKTHKIKTVKILHTGRVSYQQGTDCPVT